MSYKIFTLDEANEVLDETVKPAFERLFPALGDMATIERERAILELIVDSGAGEVNPDRSRFRRVSSRLGAVRTDIRQDIESIRATGAVVKDLRNGLVDFFALEEDQLIFLCWRRGEDRIRFWHTIESGFRGRRPIHESSRQGGTESEGAS